jgi:hypothetical protein
MTFLARVGAWLVAGQPASTPGTSFPRSSRGVAAKHHQGVGDPFVELGQGSTGRTRIVYLSGDDLDTEGHLATRP